MSGRSPRHSFWVRDSMTQQASEFVKNASSPVSGLPSWLVWSGVPDYAGALAESSQLVTRAANLTVASGQPPVVCRNPGSERYIGQGDGGVSDFVSDQQPEWGLVIPRVPVQAIDGGMSRVDVLQGWTVPVGTTIDDAYFPTTINTPADDTLSPDQIAQTITVVSDGDQIGRVSAVAEGEYTVSVWARQDPTPNPGTWRFIGNAMGATPSSEGPIFQPTDEWQQFSCQIYGDSYILQNTSNATTPVQFAYHQISTSVVGSVTHAEPRQAPQYWDDGNKAKTPATMSISQAILETPGYFDIEWVYRPYYGVLGTGQFHPLMSYLDGVSPYTLVGVYQGNFYLYQPGTSTILGTIVATWAPNDLIRLRVSNLDGLMKLTVTVPGAVQQTVSAAGAAPITSDLILGSLTGQQPTFGSDLIGVNIIR